MHADKSTCSFDSRLSELQQRASLATIPLWVDRLDDEEALKVLHDKVEPWSSLLRAEINLRMGRLAEASIELDTLQDALPLGMKRMRAQVKRDIQKATDPLGSDSTRSQSEGSDAALRQWLGRIRAFRSSEG